VASGQNLPGTVTFHTDATIYRCALDAGADVALSQTAGRRIFLYLTQGRLSANGRRMAPQDQARIDVDEPLLLKGDEPADFILVDVPSCKGWGYSAETLRGQKR
jgi:redox-sensitive bicupin YhaK (pirin superfamily)